MKLFSSPNGLKVLDLGSKKRKTILQEVFISFLREVEQALLDPEERSFLSSLVKSLQPVFQRLRDLEKIKIRVKRLESQDSQDLLEEKIKLGEHLREAFRELEVFIQWSTIIHLNARFSSL